MPRYRLLVNHHSIDEIEIEAKSPKDARRKGWNREWEEKDVVDTKGGDVDDVELLNDEGEIDFESGTDLEDEEDEE